MLFERARNAFGDAFDAIFLRVLKTVNEKRTTLNGVDVRLYAPHWDLGIKVVLQELGKNEYETDEIKFSDDDVYVDVGSNLGLVVLRLALTSSLNYFICSHITLLFFILSTYAYFLKSHFFFL